MSFLSKARNHVHFLLALAVVSAIVAFAAWAIVTAAQHDRRCVEAGGVPRGTLCLAPEAIVDF